MGTTGRGPVAQDPAGGNGLTEQESSAFRRTLAGLRLTFTSGVTGAAASAVVVGVILGRAPVFLTGGGVLLLLVLIGFVAGRRSPGPDAPPVTRTALARIEDLRATNGESADVPVEFRLTVAPEPADGRPAYRVVIDQHINLVDIPAYRPGGTAVVEYRPDEPWEVRIVTRPTPEWSRRAEAAEIDSAPASTLVENPGLGEGSWCVLVLFAFLAGAALVVLLFRGELFTSDDAAGPASDRPAVTSSASASVSASVSRTFTTSTTVSGPSSLLVPGRMRETVTELAERAGTSDVTAITVQERRMEIRGDSARPPAETLHVQMLPYELFPALVREARTTLGVRTPQSWRIDVAPDPGAWQGVGPRVRVTVTGEEGTAHLDADATARIVERRPVAKAG
ncbi:hypothetical protein G3I63_33250 [Streptomyces sp. SID8016]|uniref:hypothetical protein n=1 Tax=Streptomyces sp. SID10692 TaxID=2706026 RepID=UPI0013D93828|nr:hypothetical protein [Streptomyces sp. SID10692]NEC46505.1 hypothetical protein [Streptomyces sp. SID8016]